VSRDFLIKTFNRTGRYAKVECWGDILLAILFLSMAIFFFAESINQPAAAIIGILLLLATAGFFISSKMSGLLCLSATPMRVYADGVQISQSMMNNIRGSERFIPVDRIQHVSVKRGGDGSRGWFVNNFWKKHGLIEIEIITTDGRSYRSGAKPPSTIDSLINSIDKYKK